MRFSRVASRPSLSSSARISSESEWHAKTVSLQMLGGDRLARAVGSGQSDNHALRCSGPLMVIETGGLPKRFSGWWDARALFHSVNQQGAVAGLFAQAPGRGVFLDDP